MSNIRLSPISYLVLGMIALRGPSTPYEIERAVGYSVGRFWPFAHAQLYAEPVRLVEAGLLTESREAAGRRRRTYALTDAGLAAVQTWLRQPAAGAIEIRDEAQLQLFFGELVEEEEIVALARQQAAIHRQRLAELRAIEERFGDDPLRARRMAPLYLGVAVYQAVIDFWDGIAQNPP